MTSSGSEISELDKQLAKKMIGLEPVPFFDGSTDGTDGFGPVRLEPRGSTETERVRDGLSR